MYNNTVLSEQSNNDKQELARRLNVSVQRFNSLLDSANHAYEVIKDLGPFYGREDVKEPTFRITAEPVPLPFGSEKLLRQFGQDLASLGRALPQLPQKNKAMLGSGLDFSIPPTWRIDAILDKNGSIKVNEVEGNDGASALMMAEQFAYGLQSVSNSTAAKLISVIKKIHPSSSPLRIAYLRVNNACNPNINRFISFIEDLSNKAILVDHIFDTDIRESIVNPDWSSYTAVISESSLSLDELFSLGITREQLLIAGNYNALVNKGVFALIFDPELNEFWKEKIGRDSLERLQKLLIPSRFINTKEALLDAYKEGKVVKVTWAGTDTSLINRSQGVALPEGAIVQSSDERWQTLEKLLNNNATVISQDYVKPKQITAFLRKKGTNLEKIEWYNRVCVKYVCEDNPNDLKAPQVSLTAVEVTLGPDVIPAGRKCAFTAGALR